MNQWNYSTSWMFLKIQYETFLFVKNHKNDDGEKVWCNTEQINLVRICTSGNYTQINH